MPTEADYRTRIAAYQRALATNPNNAIVQRQLAIAERDLAILVNNTSTN